MTLSRIRRPEGELIPTNLYRRRFGHVRTIDIPTAAGVMDTGRTKTAAGRGEGAAVFHVVRCCPWEPLVCSSGAL